MVLQVVTNVQEEYAVSILLSQKMDTIGSSET